MQPAPRTVLFLSCLAVAACAPTPIPEAADEGGARRIEAHVRFLADDLLEGRRTATRGHELASLYVAEQFRALGLEPAGAQNGYFQPVPLVGGERVVEGAELVLERDGARTALAFEHDFLPDIHYAGARAEVQAGLVFVGQAVHAPEFGHDHFAGVDLAGKVAVFLPGAPASLGHAERAYFAWTVEKQRQLVARGAIGSIQLGNRADEAKRSWAAHARNWKRSAMRLADASGRAIEEFPSLRAKASVRAGIAESLFAGSGHAADEVYAALEAGKLEGFALAGTVTMRYDSRLSPAASRNVVARLAGADPDARGEHVLFTAHLDHLGLGVDTDADPIHNGAVDNALGVGVLIEAARRFVQGTPRPRRSILFVALTGEEQGLLGSEAYARTPTVPAESLVAVVNMDMPMLLTDTLDAVPVGVEHSSLQDIVSAAARESGVALSPDPFPHEVAFVRSDQLPFIRRGIPAVYLGGGVRSARPGVDGLALQRDFLATHYHRPSDEISLPIHYPSAARLAALNWRIGLAIAQAQERPRWNDGDFVFERFGGDGDKTAPSDQGR